MREHDNDMPESVNDGHAAETEASGGIVPGNGPDVGAEYEPGPSGNEETQVTLPPIPPARPSGHRRHSYADQAGDRERGSRGNYYGTGGHDRGNRGDSYGTGGHDRGSHGDSYGNRIEDYDRRGRGHYRSSGRSDEGRWSDSPPRGGNRGEDRRRGPSRGPGGPRQRNGNGHGSHGGYGANKRSSPPGGRYGRRHGEGGSHYRGERHADGRPGGRWHGQGEGGRGREDNRHGRGRSFDGGTPEAGWRPSRSDGSRTAPRGGYGRYQGQRPHGQSRPRYGAAGRTDRPRQGPRRGSYGYDGRGRDGYDGRGRDGYDGRGRDGNPSANRGDAFKAAHSQMIMKLAAGAPKDRAGDRAGRVPEARAQARADGDMAGDRTLPVSRLLAEMTGLGSRRKIGEMLESDRMTVNGQHMNAGDHMLRSDIREVVLDGRNVPVTCDPEKEPALRVLMYHKGNNELCSRFDMRGRKLIFRNLPPVHGRWISVGRLDYMTSGLLLCTNNGELAQRLMHPSYQIQREYRVRVAGKVDQGIVDMMLQGIDDGDETIRFDQVKIREHDDEEEGLNSTIDVVLHTGRNREVRRVLEAVGLEVIRLRRTRFGEFALPENSTPGNTHELSIAEKNLLLESVGMEPIAS